MARRFDTSGYQPLRYRSPNVLRPAGEGLHGIAAVLDWDGDGALDVIVGYDLDMFDGGLFLYLNIAPLGDLPRLRSAVRLSHIRGERPASWRRPDGGWDLFTLDEGKLLRYRSFGEGVVPEEVRVEGRSLSAALGGRPDQIAVVDWDGDGRWEIIAGMSDTGEYWPDGTSPWNYREHPNVGFGKGYDERGRWLGGDMHSRFLLIDNMGTNDEPILKRPKHFTVNGQPLDLNGIGNFGVADIDGDGELELVGLRRCDELAVFKRVEGDDPTKLIYFRELLPRPMRNTYFMVPLVACDWDSDGEDEFLACGNPGTLVLLDRDRQGWHEVGRVECAGGPLRVDTLAVPCVCDWDGDGDRDILVGDASGYVWLFEGHGGDYLPPVPLTSAGSVIHVQAGPNLSIQGPNEARWGYTCPLVVDWDGDGLPDLLLSDITGRHTFYRNVGTRRRPRLTSPLPLTVEDRPLVTVWRCRPTTVPGRRLPDYLSLDERGWLTRYRRDIKAGVNALKPGETIRYEDGSPVKLDGLAGHSGRAKLWACDWDGDGDWDLLVGIPAMTNRYLFGESPEVMCATVVLLENVGTAEEPILSRPRYLRHRDGRPICLGWHSCAPQAIDWDEDGELELIVGAEDGKIYLIDDLAW
jgi:hypothetical protein